jgi:hypothetical protein
MIIVDSRNIIGTTVDDNHLSMTETATDVAVVTAVESSQGEQQQQTSLPPPPQRQQQQEATNDADSDENDDKCNVLSYLFCLVELWPLLVGVLAGGDKRQRCSHMW